MNEQQIEDFDGTTMELILCQMFNMNPEYTIDIYYCHGLISEYYEKGAITANDYILLFRIVNIFE